MSAGAITGKLVAGIGMAHNPCSGIVPEDAGQPPVRRFAAVADDDYAGVLREAHADATAVMQADPRGAARSGEQGI